MFMTGFFYESRFMKTNIWEDFSLQKKMLIATEPEYLLKLKARRTLWFGQRKEEGKSRENSVNVKRG